VSAPLQVRSRRIAARFAPRWFECPRSPKSSGSCGSGAPVRRLELRTCGLHPIPTDTAMPWATALEN